MHICAKKWKNNTKIILFIQKSKKDLPLSSRCNP